MSVARNGDVLSYNLCPNYFGSAQVSGAGRDICGAEGSKA